MFEGQLDAIAGIAKVGEFDTALDRNPEFRELFSHDPLGLGLIEEHDEMIAARQPVEAQPQKPSLAMIEVGPMCLVAELEDRTRDAALLEQLQRTRLDRDGAGMGLRLRQAVNDAARHPEPSKIHGRGQACWVPRRPPSPASWRFDHDWNSPWSYSIRLQLSSKLVDRACALAVSGRSLNSTTVTRRSFVKHLAARRYCRTDASSLQRPRLAGRSQGYGARLAGGKEA
jgi:hypothetical protein